MLVPLRNACWIFVRLSLPAHIFLMDAKIQKIFNKSFVFNETFRNLQAFQWIFSNVSSFY